MLGTESKKPYLAAFDHARVRADATLPSWLRELRQAGIASFDTLGFPTTRNEDWKYTNIEPIASKAFVSPNGEADRVDLNSVLAGSFVDRDAHRLVFINGKLAPDLSSAQALPAGARVESLADLIERNDPLLAAELGHHASHRNHAFVALNTAFVNDGAVVIVPSGCRLETPIYLVFVSLTGEHPVVFHPRTLVVAGAASEVKIVESYIGFGDAAYLCNAVTELVGGAGAMIEHCRLQRESDAGFHVGAFDAVLARDCHLTAHALSLTGALIRNHVHVVLDGEGAGCELNGLYLADGKQHIDNFTEIEHVKPHGTSVELYKGILGGSAHGVFNGKIVVHKDAQKSDARQVNKNLLLAGNAVVNTKPQLEIYADDVKCSHGSTIGQMDGDALFYLRSRGLGLDQARSLLSFAFASDVIGRIKIDFLRARLDDYLAARFRRH